MISSSCSRPRLTCSTARASARAPRRRTCRRSERNSLRHGRRGLTREWIRGLAQPDLLGRPERVPALVEQGHTNDADVARVAVLLARVRARDRSEPERRDLIHALAEAVDLELGVRIEDV